MEKDHRQVAGPHFFIPALLVALVARFIGLYLETKGGLFLAWSRERRQRIEAQRTESIQAWSENEGLVILAFLRGLEPTIIMFGALLLDLLFMIHLLGAYRGDENIPAFVAAIMLTIAVFFMMWISSRRLTIAAGCFREFCRRRELPSIGK